MTRNWWEWASDETPALAYDRYCERCGAKCEFVSSTSHTRSSSTGLPLIQWHLRCPNRTRLTAWLGHTNRNVLPRRTALGLAYMDGTIEASVDPGKDAL